MNNFFNIFFIFICLITAVAFCQPSQRKEITVLAENIRWNQIISNENYCFAAGFQDNNSVLYNLTSGLTIVFHNTPKNSSIFILDDSIYFGPLASSDENEILIFNLNGVLIRKLYFDNQQMIINYFVNTQQRSKGKIFYTAINFDKYRGGKTEGKIEGGIFKLGNTDPFIKFNYNQLPPPNRIAFPITTANKDKIYLAFENEYEIICYSNKGEKLFSFKNSLKQKPYSKEEFALLPSMYKTVVQPGITFPPIIKKIIINKEDLLFVTRYPRPGTAKVIVDSFNLKGKLLKSYEFHINKNEKMIDICLFKDKFICLLTEGDSKFVLNTFTYK